MSDNRNAKFIVRPIKLSDCEQVCQIWSSLDFLIAQFDNEFMMNVDSEGILVAQDISTEKILGVCSGNNVSKDLAFIGGYIVKPEYQGKGIGYQLWNAVMAHIGPNRNIGLGCPPGEMSQKYKNKSNFNLIQERKCLYFRGKADTKHFIESIDGISVVPINEDNIERVIQYDKQVVGLERTLFIRELSKMKEYVNRVAVDQNNNILGYCVFKESIKQMWNESKSIATVEPLYANDEQIAGLLFANCYKEHWTAQNSVVIFPCWNTNSKALELAKRLGLNYWRETILMFTKRTVVPDIDRIYCLSSRCFYPF